jgi:hypothetical protein
MNRNRKETLKENLEKLDAEEHAQIFNIIKRYTETYTKTQTGVLVSSDNLPDACILEIEKMVTFYLDQRKSMEADTLKRKTLMKTN